jgi:endoglucanase
MRTNFVCAVLLLLLGTCSADIVYASEQGVLKINQKRFYLKGASWFGFETGVSTVHGLWAVDYKFIVDFLASNRFNAVRLPFSLDLVTNNPTPTSINFGSCSNDHNCNLDLKGLKSLEVLDKIINYMGTKGIAVMLDLHSFEPDAFGSNGLWYDSSHSEAAVIQGWRKLADRYRNTWNVFAIDVKNEPFQSTWNSGDLKTDFNKAAERIGDAIVNDTNWLVFVEGTANSPSCSDGCFYGEDLQGVETAPVKLSKPGRVVYSPHTYGPNVYNQNYFNDPSFPSNMPKIWDKHFGFIRIFKDAALVTGEWGGSTSGKNGVWLNAYASYLKTNDITDNFIWCVNPNSGDTGGLLLNDWMTPDTNKLAVLAKLVENPTNLLDIIKESSVQ